MLDHLPTEIFFNILRFVPLLDVQTTIPLISHHTCEVVHAENEDFWKYICEDKFHFQVGSKPQKQSWRDFSSHLDKSLHWDTERLQSSPLASSSLTIKNKGYSLESNAEGQLVCALASCPLTPDYKYFEIIVDEIAETASNADPSIGIGIATDHSFYFQDDGTPNVSTVAINGYYNTGVVKKIGPANTISAFQGFSGKYGKGDRIGVVLNFEFMTLTFYINDLMLGTPYVYLPKEPQYPAVALRGIGTRVSFSMPPKMRPPPMPLR